MIKNHHQHLGSAVIHREKSFDFDESSLEVRCCHMHSRIKVKKNKKSPTFSSDLMFQPHAVDTQEQEFSFSYYQ